MPEVSGIPVRTESLSARADLVHSGAVVTSSTSLPKSHNPSDTLQGSTLLSLELLSWIHSLQFDFCAIGSFGRPIARRAAQLSTENTSCYVR